MCDTKIPRLNHKVNLYTPQPCISLTSKEHRPKSKLHIEPIVIPQRVAPINLITTKEQLTNKVTRSRWL